MKLAALVLGVIALSPAGLAQTARTADGHPDLQGVWGAAFLTPLERPPGLDLIVPHDKVGAFAKDFREQAPSVIDPDFQIQDVRSLLMINGEARTSLIVEPKDGQLPFTAKAAKLAQRSSDMEDTWFDNPEERPTFDRCVAGMGQAPIRQLPGVIPTMIVQTPGTIVLATEDAGSLRLVHMDGAIPSAAIRTHEGWSAGRWEGDTLVVETTLTRSDDPYRGLLGRPILVGPDSKVIERFTRVSEKELLFQFTVEDKEFYSAPWKGEYVFKLSDKPWYEYACHEDNRSLVSALRAARMGKQPKRKQ